MPSVSAQTVVLNPGSEGATASEGEDLPSMYDIYNDLAVFDSALGKNMFISMYKVTETLELKACFDACDTARAENWRACRAVNGDVDPSKDAVETDIALACMEVIREKHRECLSVGETLKCFRQSFAPNK